MSIELFPWTLNVPTRWTDLGGLSESQMPPVASMTSDIPAETNGRPILVLWYTLSCLSHSAGHGPGHFWKAGMGHFCRAPKPSDVLSITEELTMAGGLANCTRMDMHSMPLLLKLQGMPERDILYDAAADRRSWNALKAFLNETLV